MLLHLPPPSPLRGGDLVIRPKLSGWGFHYGTALDSGFIAHMTPEDGKHIGSLDEFAAAKPVFIKRPNRTAVQNQIIQQRALFDIGKPYAPANANCEHDVTNVHEGAPRSPMVQSIVIGLSISTILALALGAVNNCGWRRAAAIRALRRDIGSGLGFLPPPRRLATGQSAPAGGSAPSRPSETA
jgi:hypothetical protein